jgi:hypothetical protein
MGVDDTPEGDTGVLSSCGFCQQVVILGKKYASQARRAIKEIRIGEFMGAILIGSHHIYMAQP